MRAWSYTSRGPPDQVLTLGTFPRPDPSTLEPHEVLIRVTYGGIFQSAAIIMALLPHFNSKPWIPYADFSGSIVAAGSEVTHVAVGDQVFGFPNPSKYYMTSKYNGLLTEYAVVPGCAAVKKPANVSMADAAAVGGNGVAALQFCELVGLKKGQKVLITAASSSTGSFTVQIAKWLVGESGTVVGTCSAANEDLVKGFGVDEVIDYRRYTKIHDYLTQNHSSKPFDAIIDIAGASDDLFRHSPEYLKADGIFLHVGDISVFTGAKPSVLNLLRFAARNLWRSYLPSVLGGVPRKNFLHGANIDHESLKKLSTLMKEGHLKSLIDSEWPMGDVLKAFKRAGTGRARGKVLVHVSED